MRPQPELLPQLGFPFGAALLDLLGEEPGAGLPPAQAVTQAVGGEGLGDAAGAGSGVHPDPRPGHEPEWATHQATSSPTPVRAPKAASRSRARYSRSACLSSALRSRPACRVSWRSWNRMRLRLSADRARRRPWVHEATLTTASRATMSAKSLPSIGRATGAPRSAASA